ncbi:hypothetical protein D3C86_1911910 [compost metagenome]
MTVRIGLPGMGTIGSQMFCCVFKAAERNPDHVGVSLVVDPAFDWQIHSVDP